MKKGKEKNMKITLKKGGKALKIFLGYKLICRGKNESQKMGWGKKISKCTIYIPGFI